MADAIDQSRRMNFFSRLKKILKVMTIYWVLILFLFLFLFPFYYMLIAATNDSTALYSFPPPLWLANNLSINFVNLQKFEYFFLSIINSVIIAVLATVTQIFFCTIAGYAFARYEFRGKNALFVLILGTLMIPKFFNIIPYFQMMVVFKWINTYLPLIIPNMANSFGIFLMKQFIESTVPVELIEACKMDGLTTPQILFRLVFPIEKPAIAVLGTIVFIGSWNDFMMPLIMLPNKEMFTLPLALHSLRANLGALGGDGVMMLANLIAVGPIFLVFIFASKQIIGNILAGSIKG
jgi:multiple sugar transport system permease protein